LEKTVEAQAAVIGKMEQNIDSIHMRLNEAFSRSSNLEGRPAPPPPPKAMPAPCHVQAAVEHHRIGTPPGLNHEGRPAPPPIPAPPPSMWYTKNCMFLGKWEGAYGWGFRCILCSKHVPHPPGHLNSKEHLRNCKNYFGYLDQDSELACKGRMEQGLKSLKGSLTVQHLLSLEDIKNLQRQGAPASV
jgi:hypothetical protein